ncbi:MAG TPA: YdeI/OmpD-associated family protein [Candidatus Limnocylindrales bacterium]|nr:YdeI/OmpD-associated family protein [Candidatus Limnocylindrales bacterium]
MSETFRATIVQTGKTACGIQVPEAVVTALGGSKRPAVVVTLDGYAYRSTVAPMGAEWWVGVNSDHREAFGLKAGDEVQVTLELDTAPRELEVPRELATALDADPTAKAFFDGLSYSNRRVFTLSVEGTNNPETKARRVDKVIALMREGRVR